MNKRILVSGMFLLVLSLCTSLVFAETILVDVQFQFNVGSEVFPAGKYKISTGTSSNPNTLTIRHVETGKRSMVAFVTRLAPKSENQSSIVFDRQGDKYFLSEIYMGRIDGFLLKGANAGHSHVTIKGSETTP